MTMPIDRFARRVETHPYFLASALAVYARSEGLGDAELAKLLGCSPDQLTDLRLCGRPQAEPAAAFKQDVDAIAAGLNVRADILTEIVRRADALEWLRQPVSVPSRQTPGMLLAARDRERDDDALPPSVDTLGTNDQGQPT